MKRFLCILLSIILVAAALPSYGRSAAGAPAPDAPYDGYIVKVSGESRMRTLATDAESLGSGFYRVDSPEDAVRLGGTVEYIEPDYYIYELGTPITDYTPTQWSTAAINMQAAWAEGLYGTGVKVALVDSGLYSEHEDLTKANILPVQNFTGDGLSIYDATGHGTFVGGILAAKVANTQSQGSPAIDGGASGVTILPLRVFSPTKKATVSMAVEAINYAVAQNCDVINLSVGTTAYSTALEDACNAAAAAGLLLVAAAGNWSGTYYGYPASYDSVVSVAAVQQSGASYTSASFSQQNNKVFVTAPGVNISGLGYSATNAYVADKDGTSYSAPIVAAMAALAKEQNKAITLETFRALLAATSIDLGAVGRDNTYGYGMVDYTAYVHELTRDYTITYVNTYNQPSWINNSTYALNITTAMTLATPPQRAGFDFAGWYTSSGFTGEPLYEIAPGSAGDLTLYAAWEVSDRAGVLSVSVAGIAAATSDNSNFTVTVPNGVTVDASDIVVTPTPSSSVVSVPLYNAEAGKWTFTVKPPESLTETFSLTVENSEIPAPQLALGNTYTGTVTPASLDGLVAHEPFELGLSTYFSEADNRPLTYETNSSVAVITEGVLRYSPSPNEANTTVTLTVTASNGTFSSEPLFVTINVAPRPASTSLVLIDSAAYDLYAPAAIDVSFNLYDNTVQSVAFPQRELTEGTDYTMKYSAIDGADAVVLLPAALNTLATGVKAVTFTFSAGASAQLPLTVSDTAPLYTVTFIAENSTPYAVNNEARAGSAIPLPPAPTRSGFNFGGWFTARDGDGTQFTASTLVAASLTVYAKWTAIPTGGGPTGSGPTGGGGSPDLELELEPELFTLTASAGAGGSVTPTEIGVELGGSAEFHVAPDDGYELSELLIDGEAIALPEDANVPFIYIFENIEAAHTLHASFTAVEEPPEEILFELSFTDVTENDWFYDAVNFVCQRGLFVGISDTDFAPRSTVTRGMAVTVLWRLAGNPPAPNDSVFSDVPEGMWFSEPALWAADCGIATGYGDGNFGPYNTLTREQLAVFMYRLAAQSGTVTIDESALDAFTDASSVSAWALDALRWAVSAGLITGKGGGVLDPQGLATRAELAVIITRFVILPLPPIPNR